MKYYSEILNKMFDSEESLCEAERQHTSKVSDKRKNIASAYEIYKSALQAYKDSKITCDNIRKEADRLIDNVKSKASETLADAEKNYYETISDNLSDVPYAIKVFTSGTGMDNASLEDILSMIFDEDDDNEC